MNRTMSKLLNYFKKTKEITIKNCQIVYLLGSGNKFVKAKTSK